MNYLFLLALISPIFIPGVIAVSVEKIFFNLPPEIEQTEINFRYFIVFAFTKTIIYSVVSYLLTLMIFQNSPYPVFENRFSEIAEVPDLPINLDNLINAFASSILIAIILSVGWSFIYKRVVKKSE